MPVIDPTYLPFSRDELRPHFTSDADANIDYFQQSAARYRRFLAEHESTAGIPLSSSKVPRQIEKDERFWIAASLKALYDHPRRGGVMSELLRSAFGATPPMECFATWEECLSGDLKLFFEAQLPSPSAYVEWLKEHLAERQMIPYILDAGSRKSRRQLEGPTHVDATFVNASNGFGLLIEAKVLSDVSAYVSFDNYRNQLARNVDVMLERQPKLRSSLSERLPERSLFAILTPAAFRSRPSSRLYGWLFHEYKRSPESLARDLRHRGSVDWSQVSSRLGWLTFEGIEEVCPGACPWLES